MSDIVWTALISGGTALVVSLLTQFLAARTANKQADRLERREALQWERSEARRREEIARDDARRQDDILRAEKLRQDEICREEARQGEEVLVARLQECWAHALTSRIQMLKLITHPNPEMPTLSGEAAPSACAANAYSVALLGLTDVYPLAKDFYQKTAQLEMSFVTGDTSKIVDNTTAWRLSFENLEKEVAMQMGVIPRLLSS